jgi:hypothetical protein
MSAGLTPQRRQELAEPERNVTYSVLRPPHLLSASLSRFLASPSGSDLAVLSKLFPPSWKTYVMGGILRDLLLECLRGIHLQPADVDVVIAGAPTLAQLRSYLGHAFLATNEFGAAKCQLSQGGAIFDVWRIEDHTNMAGLPSPTIEQLLRRNLLDVDAVLWNPVTNDLHDRGACDAIRAGQIDLLGPEGIAPAFLAAQAAHTVLIAHKTGLRLSQRAQDFIRGAWYGREREELLRICKRKLPAGDIEHTIEAALTGAVSLTL